MKKIFAIVLCLALVLSLGACGKKDDKVIKVGATPAPHAEVLEEVAKLLEKDGWKLEIKVFNDYVQPNNAVEDGDLDANYFQHQPYLDEFNSENKTHLVTIATVHYEPFGVYAGTKSSLEDLADGDEIAIPNDTTNRARALLLLQDNGIITLKEGVGLTATALDIVSKKVDITIREMEAAQVSKVRDSVALVVLNGNYALDAGLNVAKDAIVYEGADSLAAKTYGNVLVVKEGNEKTAKSEALKKALVSDTVRDFMNTKYEGAVVPMF